MTEIWEDLTNTGYIQHDISTCYTLSILQYSLSLKIAGMFTFAQFVEQSQICQLLPRLNLTHDPIRAQILGKERLSSLSKVFHIVQSNKAHQMFSEKATKPVNLNLENIKLNPKGK